MASLSAHTQRITAWTEPDQAIHQELRVNGRGALFLEHGDREGPGGHYQFLSTCRFFSPVPRTDSVAFLWPGISDQGDVGRGNLYSLQGRPPSHRIDGLSAFYVPWLDDVDDVSLASRHCCVVGVEGCGSWRSVELFNCWRMACRVRQRSP